MLFGRPEREKKDIVQKNNHSKCLVCVDSRLNMFSELKSSQGKDSKQEIIAVILLSQFCTD